MPDDLLHIMKASFICILIQSLEYFTCFENVNKNYELGMGLAKTKILMATGLSGLHWFVKVLEHFWESLFMYQN